MKILSVSNELVVNENERVWRVIVHVTRATDGDEARVPVNRVTQQADVLLLLDRALIR